MYFPVLLKSDVRDPSAQPMVPYQWGWPCLTMCLKFLLRKQAEMLRGLTPSPHPCQALLLPPSHSAHNPFLHASWEGHPPLPGAESLAVPGPAVESSIWACLKYI